MKKLLITLLTLAMLLNLAACGGSGNSPQTQDDPPAVGNSNGLPASGGDAGSDAAPQDAGEPDSVPDEEPSESGEEDPGETDPNEESGEPSESGPEEPDTSADATEPEDEETQSVSEVSTQPIQTDPEPTPEPEPEPEPEPAADPKAIAESLIGRPVSELYAAIGQPLSADYSPSCLDLDSDDGELTYDGFVVYTEGAPDNETVYAVF